MILDVLTIALIQAAIVGSAEVLRHSGLRPLETRKYAHIVAGCTAALLPFFVSREAALVCGAVGTFAMGYLVFKGFVRSIGEGGKVDAGALGFPLGLTLAALFFWGESALAFQYAALMLALPDAAAGYIGQKYGAPGSKGAKTYLGGAVFFSLSFAVTFALLLALEATGAAFALSLIAAAVLTATEALSGKLPDNVTVPLVAGLIAVYLFAL